jgi:methionyl-tRNA formyltransferase
VKNHVQIRPRNDSEKMQITSAPQTQKAATDLPSDAVSPTRIALFANHAPGLEIAAFLAKRSKHDQVCALYVTGEQPENDKRIIETLNLEDRNVFIGQDEILQLEHIDWFKNQKFDVIICVYWPWLLKNEIYKSVTKSINFHPALLPVNRGWFPHVHSLIDGSKTGVTLHKIEEEADTGPIWAQREVEIKPTDTAKELYNRLQREIVDLFVDKWDQIKNSEIDATSQDESSAIYHDKNEINDLDLIELSKNYSARDLINLIRARSFGNLGFAYYEENGKKIFLKLSLSETTKFES